MSGITLQQAQRNYEAMSPDEDDARGEWIDHEIEQRLPDAMDDWGRCWDVLSDLPDQQRNDVMYACGHFFASVMATDAVHALAAAAVALHRELLPLVESAIRDQLRDECEMENDDA